MPTTRQDEFAERTEHPTELRLRKARERGHVARSADLTAASAGLGAVVVLGLAGPGLLREMTRMTAAMLDAGSAPLEAGAGAWEPLAAAGGAAAIVGAVLIAVAVVAAVIDLLQVGPLVATERVHPDPSRLSPAAALARLFSGRTLVRAAMIAAKLCVVAGAGYWVLRAELPRLAAAGGLDAWRLAAEAGRTVWAAALATGVGLLALAAADWLYQRWQHRRDLGMSRRELQEEMRTSEGDWRQRHRRRDIARKLGDWRTSCEVPVASLVVYDPHGWAAALRYGPADAVPRVVAKGKDWSALRIRRTAEAAGVVAVADAAAAREICRRCRTGQEIPESLYEPVARWMAACCRGGAARPEEA